MDFIRDVNETFDGILQQLNEPSEGEEAILPLTDWVEQELSARKVPLMRWDEAANSRFSYQGHVWMNIDPCQPVFPQTFRMPMGGLWRSPENTVMRC